jgi:hypothetical protein
MRDLEKSMARQSSSMKAILERSKILIVRLLVIGFYLVLTLYTMARAARSVKEA